MTVCVARGSCLRLALQVGVGGTVQAAGLCARRVVGQGACRLVGVCAWYVCGRAFDAVFLGYGALYLVASST